MPTATSNVTLLDFLRLGYGDLHGEQIRCLHFRIDVPRDDDISPYLNLMGPYNEFLPARLIEAFRDIFNEGSPRWLNFQVGRELSPVVYAEIPAFANAVALEPPQRAAIAQDCINAFRIARASELSIDGKWITDPTHIPPMPYSVRAWWD